MESVFLVHPVLQEHQEVLDHQAVQELQDQVDLHFFGLDTGIQLVIMLLAMLFIIMVRVIYLYKIIILPLMIENQE